MSAAPSRRRLHLQLATWVVGMLAPLAAYALPLWQNMLSDTPTAYLIWIPVLAAAWGVWALMPTPAYVDDPEIDGILGFLLVALVGLALVVGPQKWPYQFVWHSDGLLLWPLWGLGLAWMLFGVGVTRRLLGPLAFLVFAWPPILTKVAAWAQGALVQFATHVFDRLSGSVSWFHAGGGSGTFLVASGGHWVPVIVSSACSGADSVLGAAILLPVLLTQFKGPRWRKAVLVGISLVGAFGFNLLRLGIVIGALHTLGAQIALGVVHQSLGFVLFAVLSVLLVYVSSALGLRARFGLKGASEIKTAGRVRWGVSVASCAGVFVLLLPLFSLPSGAPGRPLPVKTANLVALMPKLPGFSKVHTQIFNDASILGPGAVSVAETYVSKSGASVLAEIWMTPDLTALQSYGFRNCLLFHGETIRATHSFMVPPRNVATDYAVTLPPPSPGMAHTLYADVEWDGAFLLPGGHVSYLRLAVAALPHTAWPKAPTSRSSQGALTARQASFLQGATFGQWPAALGVTRTGVEDFAMVFSRQLRLQDARAEKTLSSLAAG